MEQLSQSTCIFYFTGCQVVLLWQMVLICFLLNWLQSTAFSPSPPATGFIKSSIFPQSKRQKVSPIWFVWLFIFFFTISLFLQFSSTLMKITYNNFRDLNMLALLESMRYDTLPWNDWNTHFGEMLNLWSWIYYLWVRENSGLCVLLDCDSEHLVKIV